MQFTNKKGLPGLLANAIINENKKYSKGRADVSVTQLIDAPLVKILKDRHNAEITEDVSDRLWAFFGQVGHGIIANIDADNVLFKEKRLFVEVSGWTISGQPDLVYKDNNGDVVLCDFKVTSGYAIANRESDKPKHKAKPDYIKQLNIYKYMLDQHDIHIDRLEIVAIVRDASFYEDKVAVIPVKAFKDYKIKKYIEQRVAAHKLYSSDLLARPPECLPEERWQAPARFCVVKEGNTKQTGRDYEDFDEINRFLVELYEKHPKDKYFIKKKEQKPKRCEGYCSVSRFCEYYQEYLETGVFHDSTKEIEGKII